MIERRQSAADARASGFVAEDDYLPLSGIQHFVYCRRQWALIHLEAAWADNGLTVSGQLLHARAHDAAATEKRGDLLITRAMPVISHTMAVRGVCDVVEFRRDPAGVSLHGREGLWLPCPVEYKRGRPKTHGADRFQLCAQAICLEEMLLCQPLETACLFYGETKRREELVLDETLRQAVRDAFAEMHACFERRYTPRVKAHKGCASCSLRDVCLPEMPAEGRVAVYIKNTLAEDES